MLTRIHSTFALTCLLAGSLCAASDPFCGKWKLNQQKSKMTGQQMKIEDLGNNQFKFSSGNDSDTFTANGTDQPTRSGTTISLTKEGPNRMRMIYKKDGKVIGSMIRTLSADGTSYANQGTGTKPDGTTTNFESSYKRIGSGSGWSGTWESADVQFNSPEEFEISPYGTHGLTFYTRAYKDTLNINFDGQEYTETGPYVTPGSTSSGKRVDTHTLELTDKIKGKVMDHNKAEVSSDGRTLTVTVQGTDQPKAQIYIYDKM